MKVLVVGGGAREHAIVWRLGRSPKVGELIAAPGNAGTARLARNVPIEAGDIDGLARFATGEGVDLTVVGPEAPLAAGIVDRFNGLGLEAFGPTKAAARIESSKAFAKGLMLANGVPTGAARVCSSFLEAADYVERCPLPVVLKADGLAAGKGVVVAHTRREAQHALHDMMVERKFGKAGDRVLVEEFLEGREISVFAFVHGERVSPLVAARDYKRVLTGDLGPNTGGMGSYSPPIAWTPEFEDRVRREFMEPMARALATQGAPYRGVLYAGLILTEDGPKVLEFNCRLGDPEAQVILPRLKSDLLEVIISTVRGSPGLASIEWDATPCVGVVMASEGYPEAYETGFPISGLDAVDSDVHVFHAGTALAESGDVVTHGGRVLTVAAVAPTLEGARRRAYERVSRIAFEGAFYRSDIAESV